MPKESQEVIKEKIKKVADGIINNSDGFPRIHIDVLKDLNTIITGRGMKQPSSGYSNVCDFITKHREAFEKFDISASSFPGRPKSILFRGNRLAILFPKQV